ncbi:MAG: FAD-binding oxidoreductase [Proteobacteria bacterium]|nr:FAD-binding oxidoreductase [Pseudomonadota bacterium]
MTDKLAAIINADQANSWYRHSLETAFSSTSAPVNTQTKVCVVGAGFAGLAAATGLHERGFDDVVVVEAGEVGHGASGRNGGFIFGGYSLSPQALVRQQGVFRAREMYQLTTTAVELIRQRVAQYQLDCQFHDAGVMLADWFDRPDKLHKEMQFMNQSMGANWEFVPRSQLCRQLETDRYYDGLLETDAAHFHPLAYATGLAKVLDNAGIPVWQHCPVTSIQRDGNRWCVKAGEVEVIADQVVLACGGYQQILKAKPRQAILPISTYIMVTERLPELLPKLIRPAWAVYDTRFAFDYYRPLPDQRLLWGGRITVRDPDVKTIEKRLRADMARVFPALANVKADYVWSGLMGYPRHEMPMIGESEPGLWHLTGFGGHGVAPTTAIGDLLAAAISENDKRYQWFKQYDLKSVFGAAGLIAAQLNYWYLQTRDYWRDPQR